MPILSFVTTKGGVGKSLLTRLVSTQMAFASGVPVHLICADHPQHSVWNWYQRVKDKEGFPSALSVHLCESDEDMVTILGTLLDGPDSANNVIMIDPGGQEGKMMRFTVSASNIVLVPSRPHPEETLEAIHVIRSILEFNPDVEDAIRVVFNDVDPIGTKRQTYKTAEAMLAEANIQRFGTKILHRDIYTLFGFDKPSLYAVDLERGYGEKSESCAKAEANINDLLIELMSMVAERADV